MKRLMVSFMVLLMVLVLGFSPAQAGEKDKATAALAKLVSTVYYFGYYGNDCGEVFLKFSETWATETAVTMERICWIGAQDRNTGDYRLKELLDIARSQKDKK